MGPGRALADLDGAIADFTKVIQLHPYDASAYDFRGIAKALKDDFDGAMADYSKAIEVDPLYTVAADHLEAMKRKRVK